MMCCLQRELCVPSVCGDAAVAGVWRWSRFSLWLCTSCHHSLELRIHLPVLTYLVSYYEGHPESNRDCMMIVYSLVWAEFHSRTNMHHNNFRQRCKLLTEIKFFKVSLGLTSLYGELSDELHQQSLTIVWLKSAVLCITYQLSHW